MQGCDKFTLWMIKTIFFPGMFVKICLNFS